MLLRLNHLVINLQNVSAISIEEENKRIIFYTKGSADTPITFWYEKEDLEEVRKAISILNYMTPNILVEEGRQRFLHGLKTLSGMYFDQERKTDEANKIKN